MYAALYTYPWDVIDESAELFCEHAREQLGVDTISLAASYHAAKLILPHNPHRKGLLPGGRLALFPTRPGGLRRFADSAACQ